MNTNALYSALAAALFLLSYAAPSYADRAHGIDALCDLNVTSTLEQPDLSRAVDVVLVGDGFTDIDTWRVAAARMIEVIREEQLGTTIYPAVAEVYNFHVVDVLSETDEVTDDDTQDTPLGMRVQGWSFIGVNGYYASLAAANAPDVDVVYAIANANGGRANASYPSALTTGGAVRMSLDTIHATHELGHAVFRLADEYTEDSACNPNNTEATFTRMRNITRDPACAKFATTPDSECVEGGFYCRAGHFRAASACVMRSSGNTEPCPVCRRAIETMLLERRTGGDFGEPWAVLQQPAEGQVVSGLMDIRVDTFDDFRTPSRVTLELDGSPIETLDVPGTATTTLDTHILSEGPHTLSPLVFDDAGHGRRGPQVTFVVQNTNDQQAPQVRILNPSGGAVSGRVFVQARADDAMTGEVDQNIDVLALYANDQLIAADPGGWTSAEWDTSELEPGPYTLRAVARDDAQNVAEATVQVQVNPDNGTPSRTPFVFIGSPERWDPVGAAFLLGFSYGNTQDIGARFELLVDGAPAQPDPFDGWTPPTNGDREEGRAEILVDASDWAQGQRSLQLRVRYGDDQEVRSASLVVYRAEPRGLQVLMVPPPRAAAGELTVEGVVLGADAPVELGLEVPGFGVVATAPPGGDTITWDTTTLEDGCYGVRLTATSGDAWAVSSNRELCIINAPLQLTWIAPRDGATLPAGPHAFEVRVVEGSLPLGFTVAAWSGDTRLTTPISSAYSVRLPVELTSEMTHLDVRGEDTLGRTLEPVRVEFTVEACAVAADCDDGDDCTQDTCAPSGLCLRVPSAGCCEDVTDCDDGLACTTDTCVDGVCAYDRERDCCDNDLPCIEAAEACQIGRCEENACVFTPNPACCNEDSDCDDGDDCTTNTCLEQGICVTSRQAGCCQEDSDCDDGNPCTTATCGDDGACVTAEVEGCCVTAADCGADPFACEEADCAFNRCVLSPREGCCDSPEDCVTYDPCETAVCDGETATCVVTDIPGCCFVDSDCDDRNTCTQDSCDDGQCVNRNTCCTFDADCDDGDACTQDLCRQGSCSWPLAEGCCAFDRDCDDQDPCTIDTCDGDQCGATPIVGCCNTNADCGDSGDACTQALCLDNACVMAPIEGCCEGDADCDDGTACTTNTCVDGACVREAVEGCCEEDVDCEDTNPCTREQCVDGACVFLRNVGCCLSDATCQDGDVCATGRCDEGTCATTPNPTCCEEDADCAADGDVCTEARCQGNLCVQEEVEGCCASDRDCGDDNPCTVDRCQDNTCRFFGIPGCCQVDGDCADDGDVCTEAQCVQGQCRTTLVEGCCQSEEDCPDGECLSASCVDGMCAYEEQEACCFDDEQCDDGLVCTDDFCLDGRCFNGPVEECFCEEDRECDDGNACTVGRCGEEGVCVYAQVLNCCSRDGDCEDRDICTTNTCIDNVCQVAPVLGCCNTNDECDDGDACTADVCELSSCRSDYIGGEGCCEEDSECDDGDACTTDACEAHACVASPVEGCCEVAEDCDDDDVCTSDFCHEGRCHYAASPECVDAEPDTGVPDTEVPDTADDTTEPEDTAEPDTAEGPDTASPDSAAPDTAEPDAAEDTSLVEDTSTDVDTSGGGGCDGCSTTEGGGLGGVLWVVLVWVVWWRRF